MDEEPYEWIPTAEQTPTGHDLAGAPRRWRVQLQLVPRDRVRAERAWRLVSVYCLVVVYWFVKNVPPVLTCARAVQGDVSRHGSFADWRVLLAVSRSLVPAFRRLLEAGGAKIVRDS